MGGGMESRGEKERTSRFGEVEEGEMRKEREVGDEKEILDQPKNDKPLEKQHHDEQRQTERLIFSCPILFYSILVFYSVYFLCLTWFVGCGGELHCFTAAASRDSRQLSTATTTLSLAGHAGHAGHSPYYALLQSCLTPRSTRSSCVSKTYAPSPADELSISRCWRSCATMSCGRSRHESTRRTFTGISWEHCRWRWQLRWRLIWT